MTEERFILDLKFQRHKVGSGNVTTHFLSFEPLRAPPR